MLAFNCLEEKSKGLTWSDLDKAARKELLGACPLHRLEVEMSELACLGQRGAEGTVLLRAD